MKGAESNRVPRPASGILESSGCCVEPEASGLLFIARETGKKTKRGCGSCLFLAVLCFPILFNRSFQKPIVVFHGLVVP